MTLARVFVELYQYECVSQTYFPWLSVSLVSACASCLSVFGQLSFPDWAVMNSAHTGGVASVTSVSVAKYAGVFVCASSAKMTVLV